MSGIPPHVRVPTAEQFREYAAEHHIEVTDDEVEDFRTLADGLLEEYERLDLLSEPTLRAPYTDRDPGYRPEADEDPLNAFVTKCRIEGADDGPLSGYDVGVKDTVSVAGVAMTNGSKLMPHYVPEVDATIVTRLLEAGATITGKTNMEDLSHSGSGELSATGPVSNPRDADHIAGGSSGGSAAAVVAGDVDVAIGGDQGGSIRIPAAWSGCVGHKPTHGLVPYTGVIGFGRSFDHVGPMATTTEDCARTLAVLAGEDGLDPRQRGVEVRDYVDALGPDPGELTVGVLEEGFEREEAEEGVNEAVEGALEAFGDEGATVERVSVPEHDDAYAVWLAVFLEEAAAYVKSNGVGHYGKGFYDTGFATAFGAAKRARANEMPAGLKFALAMGSYLAEEYQGGYHAKAQNLRRSVAGAYDDALEGVDVLAMPTTPQTAHEVREDLSRVEAVGRAWNMLGNTAPFDITGHPATTVPCGVADGLPVGLMVVGREFADDAALAAASAFEERVDVELE
jgi:amidase